MVIDNLVIEILSDDSEISFRLKQLPNSEFPNYTMSSKFAEPMTRLIDELKKLPGIGSKTAQRLAFHILRSSDEDAEALAAAVRDVKASLRLCSICNNITDVDPCVYCSSATRNQRLVCVVEEPTNIAAIEKTQTLQWRLSRAARNNFSVARRRSRAVAHLEFDAAGRRWRRG